MTAEVTASILVPSFVLLSLFHQDFDQTFKSTKLFEKSGLKALISCSIFSKFERN